jgi:hypothetical protein
MIFGEEDANMKLQAWDRKMKHTSSLLVCFCLLALTPVVEAPASLGAGCAAPPAPPPVTWLMAWSRTGLGMLEFTGLVVLNGIAARPWPLLGVPLMVPDILHKAGGSAKIGLISGGWKVYAKSSREGDVCWQCAVDARETLVRHCTR